MLEESVIVLVIPVHQSNSRIGKVIERQGLPNRVDRGFRITGMVLTHLYYPLEVEMGGPGDWNAMFSERLEDPNA